jgi:hypothetical protein
MEKELVSMEIRDPKLCASTHLVQQRESGQEHHSLPFGMTLMQRQHRKEQKSFYEPNIIQVVTKTGDQPVER